MQFVGYVGRLLRGDLGTSLYTTRPIADDLASRLPATIELTLVAMAVSVLVGIPLGVVSALPRNSVLDHALRAITVSGLAIASFWLGIMLQLLFAMRLGWVPLNGRLQGFPPRGVTGLVLVDAVLTGDGAAFASALGHLALPAATLAFPALATLVRFTRAGVLEVSRTSSSASAPWGCRARWAHIGAERVRYSLGHRCCHPVEDQLPNEVFARDELPFGFRLQV